MKEDIMLNSLMVVAAFSRFLQDTYIVNDISRQTYKLASVDSVI